MDERFERYEIDKMFNLYLIEYESANELIVYSQHLLEEFDIYVSNLNTEVIEILINNDIAYMCNIESSLEDIVHILWNDGVYFYSIYGNVDFNELIKMAESIN